MTEGGMDRFDRGDCWSYKCDSEPDGWIVAHDGDSFAVCEGHGRVFEQGGWDRYEPQEGH